MDEKTTMETFNLLIKIIADLQAIVRNLKDATNANTEAIKHINQILKEQGL